MYGCVTLQSVLVALQSLLVVITAGVVLSEFIPTDFELWATRLRNFIAANEDITLFQAQNRPVVKINFLS